MKRVVVDLTRLGRLCGFGQICDHFAAHLSRLSLPDMRFLFLVREGYAGRFGDKVDYFVVREYHKYFPFLLPKADLWHATDQQFRFRRTGRGIRQLLTVHDLNFLYEKTPLKIKKYLWKVQRMVDKSDVVTCISRYTADEVKAHIRMGRRPLEVIPNGVEDVAGAAAPEFPAFLKAMGDSPEKPAPFFFAIGQIRAKKNFHLLVDMMRHFPHHRLYVCGDDHFEYASVVRRHIADNPAHNAHLCGKITQGEKAWLYAHCDAFLFAGKLEGFGLPAIEAMQFGRPVFAAPFGSLPEVCGPHAYYFPASLEPAAMAAAVQSGLADFAARPAAPGELRRYAATFGYEHYTRAYVALYRRMLGLEPLSPVPTL